MTHLRSDHATDTHAPDAPYSPNPERSGRVAHSVLTQPTLLALITSFQLGLPSGTGPLIARYLRTTIANDKYNKASIPMSFAAVCDLWDRPNLQAACHKWCNPYALETLTKNGSPSEVSLVHAWVTRNLALAGRQTSRQQTLQYACAAADAYGRDDVLTWLGDTFAAELAMMPRLARFPTPMSARVASATKWRVRVMAEAIATYDNESLDALQFVIRSVTSQRQLKPERTRRHVVHRVWEAAATLGRVDILTWLYTTQRDALVSLPALSRMAAKLAVRYGHVTVLTWLETTVGDTDPFIAIATVNLTRTVRHGHLELVRWMAQHSLGVAPVGAAYVAVIQRRLDLLREVLHFPIRTETTTPIDTTTPMRFEARQTHALAKYMASTAAGYNSNREAWDATAQLITTGCPFPIELLQDAIHWDDVPMIQYMLAHLHDAVLVTPATWLVHRLIERNDALVLRLMAATTVQRSELRRVLGASVLLWLPSITTSHAVLESLMRLSPTGEIASVLIRRALQGDAARAESVLTLTMAINRPLPVDVVAFVRRVLDRTLGPLASLALCYRSGADDAHVLETVVHRVALASASREDVRDAVLGLVVGTSSDATLRVLEADASGRCYCDDAFLRVGLSLRRDIDHPFNDGLKRFLGDAAAAR